jgi:hypothetical protein
MGRHGSAYYGVGRRGDLLLLKNMDAEYDKSR